MFYVKTSWTMLAHDIWTKSSSASVSLKIVELLFKEEHSLVKINIERFMIYKEIL